MKPIFILCEGPHDIAFLGRLLKAADVERYKAALDEYQPRSLREFLIGRFKRRDVSGGRFRSTSTIVLENPPILEAAYKLDDPERLLLFHRCVGENQKVANRQFLSDLVLLAQNGAPDVGIPSFSVIFVCDADDAGVDGKIAALRSDYGDVLEPVLPSFRELIANAPDKIVRCGDFSAGCCVFTSSGKTTGTLEDVVYPLLYQGISARLDDAQKYVATHGVSGTEVARGKNPSAKKQKAALTIAGQIDSPGYALSVVLRDTPAFDDDLLRADTACNTLVQTIIQI